MKDECRIASEFITSLISSSSQSRSPSKTERKNADKLRNHLENALMERCSTSTWSYDDPSKGNGKRAFFCTQNRIDPILFRALSQTVSENNSEPLDISITDLLIREIMGKVPGELVVWIDPGCVSYRMSEWGHITAIYSLQDNNTTETVSSNNRIRSISESSSNSFDLKQKPKNGKKGTQATTMEWKKDQVKKIVLSTPISTPNASMHSRNKSRDVSVVDSLSSQ